MCETWTERYDSINDAYTPGEILPPVKNEWRYCYDAFFWRVEIFGQVPGNSGFQIKHYIPMKSSKKPKLSGDVVGVYRDELNEEPRWLFYKFTEASITKFIVKVRYRLISDDDDGVIIEYKEDEAVAVNENGNF